MSYATTPLYFRLSMPSLWHHDNYINDDDGDYDVGWLIDFREVLYRMKCDYIASANRDKNTLDSMSMDFYFDYIDVILLQNNSIKFAVPFNILVEVEMQKRKK